MSPADSERWTAVDRYISDTLIPSDPALDAALAASDAARLPAIQVTASQGKLLHLLARAIGARSILEIGTLGGYSTLWLARALLAGGRVITLEIDPRHAEVAHANFIRAQVADRVELILGAALDTLPTLEREQRGPFDLIFIDADKANLADYFSWSMRLARVGSLIVVDNVVREGEILDERSHDASVRGTRALYAVMGAEPRVTATAIQTVGSKGYDGFAIARVR